MPRAYEEKGASESQNEEKGAYENQKSLKVRGAYESLNAGLRTFVNDVTAWGGGRDDCKA